MEMSRKVDGDRRLVILWTVAMLALNVLATVAFSTSMHRNRAAAERRHTERMAPVALASGVAADDSGLPPGAQPVEMRVGIYVDRISALSLKDSAWSVDFYIWFRWHGKAIDVGEAFDVVDGSITARKKDAEYVDGDEHYLRYRATAEITKLFDVTRFPLDDHLLMISIEHPGLQRSELLFVPDEGSEISSRAGVSAYGLKMAGVVEKPHAYKTRRGDPRLPSDYTSVHSQFRLGISMFRPDWGFFFKLFQGLFAALAVAVAVFFIKPTHVDPRFGLGVGAFFAAAANAYVTSSLIPDTGAMTLADIINGVALVTIFLTVVQSIVSLHIFDNRGEEALSRAYDRVSFWLFAAGTIAFNGAVALAAAW